MMYKQKDEVFIHNHLTKSHTVPIVQFNFHPINNRSSINIEQLLHTRKHFIIKYILIELLKISENKIKYHKYSQTLP